MRQVVHRSDSKESIDLPADNPPPLGDLLISLVSRPRNATERMGLETMTSE